MFDAHSAFPKSSLTFVLSFLTLKDNHFNPTIMTQALYRCYRYGQSKPVFAYRFMTEGSMEEKIYSRSVNKTGVALRVIDGKSIGRHFTERELKDLQTTDTWVQCDG
jgi:transcriptional regulator ATRX